MEPKVKVKKTRAQKKFLTVGMIASGLALLFAIGTIVTAVKLPKTNSLNSIVENDIIQNLYKGEDNSYYITSLKKNGEQVLEGNIYHVDSKDKVTQKFKLHDEAENKYGITNLTSMYGFYPDYTSGNAYAACGRYLFSLSGLKSDSLALNGYVGPFNGDVKNVITSNNDLYAIVLEGSLGHIYRYDLGDTSFTLKGEGYLYGVEENFIDNEYTLKWFDFQANAFLKTYADDNFLYLFSKTFSFAIRKDLSACNYRLLYNKALVEKGSKEAALQYCYDTYKWKTYDPFLDTVVIKKANFDESCICYYLHDAKYGCAIYKNDAIFLGSNQYIYTSPISNLSIGTPVSNLDEKIIIHYDKTTAHGLSEKDNAISYFNVGDKAVIRYDDTTKDVSVFDLKTLTIETTVEVSYLISDAFVNEDTNVMYYKYQTKLSGGIFSNNNISSVNVTLKLNGKVTKTLLIAFSVLLGVSLITLIVCFVAYGSKKGITKVLDTGKGLKKHWPIYLIILPSFALLCLFCYYPGISAIITSFFEYKPATSDLMVWNNFDNYVKIFGNPESLRTFLNMLIFLAADILLAIVPPLIFAFFLSVLKSKKLSGVLRTLLFIPGIIPGIAGILIWQNCIYGQHGVINMIIEAAGGTKIVNFFDSQNYLSIISLLMMGFPFVGSYLIFYGAMMNIPSSYYEAAEIDGITVFKRFIKIDLPLCLPQLKYVFIMTIIASIQNFSRIWVGMSKDPGIISTPITTMYDAMYNQGDNGLASAYATIIFVILFGLTFISMRKKASNQIK